MSNSWCNECFDNSHNNSCSCSEETNYPNYYYSNSSMDYNYSDKMNYDYSQGYEATKYHPLSYQSSYEDDWYYNGRFNASVPYQYSTMPIRRDLYPSMDGTYWNKQQQQQQQQQQQHVQIVPNFKSNNIGSSTNNPTTNNNNNNSNPNADPLNALQNLTVSAGQAGQMMNQQSSMNIRMNPTNYNSQVRDRTQCSANLQRPMDKYSVVHPVSQPMSSTPVTQIPLQGHSSTGGHSSTLNFARQTNKSIVIKSDIGMTNSPSMSSSMSTPYSLDSSGTPNNSQQVSYQTYQIPHSSKMYQSCIQNSSSQILAQPPPTSVSPAYSTNLPPDQSRPTTMTTLVNKATVVITDDEIKKVAEEIKRLKGRYLKTLKSILEIQKKFSDEEIKVWKVLRNILENPEGISKPLSLKHVAKIEQHLNKAEHLLANESSHLPNSSQASDNVKQLTSTRRPLGGSSLRSPKHDTVESGLELMNSKSLDLAFEDVCLQLVRSDPEMIKRLQKGLVKYVQSKQQIHSHFLPKRFFSEDCDEDDLSRVSKRQRLGSTFDEDEFNYLDDLTIGTFGPTTTTFHDNIFDNDGLLRTDLDLNEMDIYQYDLETELDLLSREFEVEEGEPEEISTKWCTFESEWDESCFFTMTYPLKTLPEDVPPLKVRISGDYLFSRSIDWNLNEEMYQGRCSSVFLGMVKDNLRECFSRVHQRYQWSGLSLIYVASAYKHSIIAAKSKYQSTIDQQLER